MTIVEHYRRAGIKPFFVIAIPLALAYLAEFMMFVTTKFVVGDLGYVYLATVGIAGNITLEVLLVMMSLLSVVGVLIAQAEGGGKHAEMGLSVRHGFYVATALGVLATWGILNLDKFLALTNQDPQVVELSRDYLLGLSAMVFPTLWFAVLRSFVAVLSQTVSIMVITLSGVVLNYLFTLWFVYGGLGLEPMGLFGAGLATSLVAWLMFLALLFHVYRGKKFRGFGIFQGRWTFSPVTTREIVILGLPVAGIALLESGLFMVVGILSGAINAETLAATEIALSWLGVPFCLAFGFAEATMFLVAKAAGRHNADDIRTAGFMGMTLAVLLVIAFTVVPAFYPSLIIDFFISESDPGYLKVSELAEQLLLIASLFLIFDALQATASRALRGMKDMLVPLWIAGFGYWGLGVGGGAWLAFGMGYEGVGLWWALAFALTVTAVMLVTRFHVISKRFPTTAAKN